MSDESYRIQKRLDAPERIGPLTWDEAIGGFLPVFISMFFNEMLVGAGIGFAIFVALRKFKGSHHANTLLFALYWNLPPEVAKFEFRVTPPGSSRFYLG